MNNCEVLQSTESILVPPHGGLAEEFQGKILKAIEALWAFKELDLGDLYDY